MTDTKLKEKPADLIGKYVSLRDHAQGRRRVRELRTRKSTTRR